MNLSKITKVTNNGKMPGAFNAFLKLISIESRCNRILGDEEYLIAEKSDCWLTFAMEAELALITSDKIAALAVSAYRNDQYLYCFEYRDGYCMFQARNEAGLVKRFDEIENHLYSAFGHAYLDKDLGTACGAV